LATSDDNPPRDGFLMFRRAEDGKASALRVSDVKALTPPSADERGETIIVSRWNEPLFASDPIEDLIARLNILLGHTSPEVVPRRTNAALQAQHRPNFAGVILR
jgi:hypothetical protein